MFGRKGLARETPARSQDRDAAAPAALPEGRLWHLHGDLRMPNSDAHVARQYKPGKALDGDPGAIALAEERPDIPLAFRRGAHALRQGCRVAPDPLVRAYQWPSAKPLDLIENVYTIVSAAFRDAVEALEPGVHQFEPVRLLDASGAAETHFVLVVAKRLDCVNADASRGYVRTEGPHEWSGRQWRYDETSADARLVYSRAAAAGHHLWFAGDVLSNRTMLVSDALKRRLEEAGLRGLLFTEAPST